MSKQFGDLSAAEQKELVTKIAQCLKDNGLEDTEVSIYREEVAQLTAAEVKGRTSLSVEKKLPTTKQAQADAFNAAVKPIIEGYEGIKMSVVCAINAGDMYKTITNVTTLDDDKTPVNIEHKQGDVLLIDFWATWCPPCQRPMAHN